MGTWKDDIISVFKKKGGVASLSDIYYEIVLIRDNLPKTYKAIIRKIIEEHSSDSKNFLFREDLFYSVEGIGSGIWGLRNYNKE